MNTAKTLTWLHLSDLHCCNPKSKWDAHLVMTTLVKDLKRMQAEQGLRPDFIFFTGDAAYGEIGSSKGETIVEQFESAKLFFDSVRKAFEPEILAENIFLVPGNHDVNRKKVSEVDIKFLDDSPSFEKILDWIKKANPDWRRWMERLEHYRNFLTSSGYAHLLEDKDRLIYAVQREVHGTRVGIVGLNTAWACCRDGEKAKLWWGGKWQIGNLRPAIEDCSFTIGLLHHPPNWF
ncbi:MAG: metallophosphoesterase, partial [Verrucomicrobia bacterium]|nr:metallophosphoesterase [Verrucomicrobiota bacterium]